MAKLGKAAAKRRGRAPKNKQIAALEAMLASGTGFLLADNNGLTVEAATKVRTQFRNANVKCKIAKNRLIQIAMKNKGIHVPEVDKLLKGPTMLITGADELITPAKLLVAAAKENEKLLVKGGMFEGKLLDANGVDLLSKTPGREELLGRLCGSLMAPAQKTVYALNQAVSKVVYAVDAHRRKLEEGAA